MRSPCARTSPRQCSGRPAGPVNTTAKQRPWSMEKGCLITRCKVGAGCPITLELRFRYTTHRCLATGSTPRCTRPGLTVAALSKIVGVSQQSVSRWRVGAVLPRGGRIGKLALALDLDATEVIAELERHADSAKPPPSTPIAHDSLQIEIWDLSERLAREERVLGVQRQGSGRELVRDGLLVAGVRGRPFRPSVRACTPASSSSRQGLA
jgi:transcriptional regulator with XRE-family HTH domain